MLRILVALFCMLILAGCAGTAPLAVAPTLLPTSAPRVQPTPTPLPSATVAPTATPAPTATQEPTAAPEPTATLEPTATPTPDPVAGVTPPDLRARAYGDGAISIGAVYNRGRGYTTYLMRYPSADGLRLTGLLHIPDGAGPFQVLIANRGYIAPERYQPGMDSRAFAEYFASRGYLVIAPDYRGYGGGDSGPNPFYTGYAIDVLSLIPLAQQLPMARPGPVGMWGHSRGGSSTVVAITASDQIGAAVVYAPAFADLAEDYARRFRQSGGNPGNDTFPFPPEADPDAYARVSPINHFAVVTAPVMLHHGTADTTVDASASVKIAAALEAAGKPVTLHLYEGGPHTLVGAQERLYFERTLAFFEQHLSAP
jgi:uncharacterized protein